MTLFGSIKTDLINKLREYINKRSIKFNVNLESTYSKPNVIDSTENRSFIISTMPIFMDTDLETIISEKLSTLITRKICICQGVVVLL